MFSGMYEHTIDEKGRISLPARLRDLCLSSADNPVILTTHIADPCLQLYTKEAWDQLLQKIASLPQFSPATTLLKRRFVAPAMELQPDSHGRIVIPQIQRRYADLKRDVLWVGMVDNLELWDRDSYYAWREQNPISSDDLNQLASLGL